MHAIHVISGIDAALGGPVSALVGLARAQAANGVRVTVAPSLPDGQPPATVEYLRQAGVEVHPIGPVTGHRGHHPQMKQLLAPVIAQSDVVHIFGLYEPIQHATAAVCREMKKPYIFEPCGMLDRWALGRRWLKKMIYLQLRLRGDLNRARALHVATTWERDETAPLRLKSPMVVVPIGVELAEFQDLPPRGEFRARFPQLEGKPVIMFLGRIFPGKGLEMLIPALARMKNRDAVIAVVGPDSGFAPRARQMSIEHKVEDRVIFTGMARGRERISALVDADVFSLPSEHENFGVAVLEALAAGIPAIVSDQVGLCHDITNARAGQTVPMQVEPLAAALDAWLADEPMRRAAGIAARKLAFENYSWDQIARKWNMVYEELGIKK